MNFSKTFNNEDWACAKKEFEKIFKKFEELDLADDSIESARNPFDEIFDQASLMHQEDARRVQLAFKGFAAAVAVLLVLVAPAIPDTFSSKKSALQSRVDVAISLGKEL